MQSIGEAQVSSEAAPRSTVIRDVNRNFSMLIPSLTSSLRSTCIIRLLAQLPGDRAALYEQFMRSSPLRTECFG